MTGIRPQSVFQRELFWRPIVANNTIIKIEAGKNQNPTLETLKKIAKALACSSVARSVGGK
ncbi:helix-turn-helix domain-containing protein [Patescibacteria group bacterium]|nr:helix-turn-helix domain-containing protein [Patescibacteria group bacterium]